MEDIECFAIRKLFINEILLADKPELKCALRHSAMLNYDFNVRRPMVQYKKTYIANLNSKSLRNVDIQVSRFEQV